MSQERELMDALDESLGQRASCSVPVLNVLFDGAAMALETKAAEHAAWRGRRIVKFLGLRKVPQKYGSLGMQADLYLDWIEV